jgi:hypothetical protein
VVFDAFRLTAIGEGARQAGGDGSDLGQTDIERGGGDGGTTCSVAAGTRAPMWALSLLLLGLRRRVAFRRG